MNSYKYTYRIDYTTVYYDSSVTNERSKHCLEEIKFNYLKKKSVILQNTNVNQINAVYPKEIRDRWLNLLKIELNLPFLYEESEYCHTLTLNYVDFRTINELYILMLLIRYLWYAENNMLIYRIFDILDKSPKLNFSQALYLAHMYDDVSRNNTFNLFNKCIVPYELSLKNFIDHILLSQNIHNATLKLYGLENSNSCSIFMLFLKHKPLSEDYYNEYYRLVDFLQSKLYYTSYNDLYKIKSILNFFNYNHNSIEESTFSKCKEGDKIIIGINPKFYQLINKRSTESYVVKDLLTNNESVVYYSENTKIYKIT